MSKLVELRAEIKRERRWVGIRQYSHQVIGWTLAVIAEEFGKDEANKAIRELNLIELGWDEEP